MNIEGFPSRLNLLLRAYLEGSPICSRSLLDNKECLFATLLL